MKKIPTLFVRDPKTNLKYLTDEVHPDCLWVFKGEGLATVKLDGTCVKVEGGRLFKRREIKKGQEIPKVMDVEDVDEKTGKTVGWVPARRDNPEDKWNYEAWDNANMPDGTYELIGPKVQGNPYSRKDHWLSKHGCELRGDMLGWKPKGKDEIKEMLAKHPEIEGIVWHHPDGRMAKIKQRDFPGHHWPPLKK